MQRNTYAIEIIITLSSFWDMKASIKKGRRARHYCLSRETEQAIEIKKKYLKGEMPEESYKSWCYRWVENHDITDEDWRYLDGNQYLQWLKNSTK